MSNQIIFGGNISPVDSPMEISYNGGITWYTTIFSTTGGAQQGVARSIPAGTYAIGQIIERAIGYPASAKSNQTALIIVSASTSGFNKGRFVFFGEADNSNNTPSQFADLSSNNNHFPQPNSANLPAQAPAADGLVGYTMGSGKYFNNGLTQAAGDFVFYFVLTLTSAQSSMYAYDTQSHGLLLGAGPDGLIYEAGIGANGANIALPVGNRMILRYALTSNGSTVSINERVIYAGTYTRVALSGGRLGCDFSTDSYAPIPGSLFCLAVVAGLETLAQAADTHSYLRTKNSIFYATKTEVFKNSNFSSPETGDKSTGWQCTAGASTITNGGLNLNGNSDTLQTVAMTVGQSYTLTVTLASCTIGEVQILTGSGSGNGQIGSGLIKAGRFTGSVTFTAVSASEVYYIRGAGGTDAIMSNISLMLSNS